VPPSALRDLAFVEECVSVRPRCRVLERQETRQRSRPPLASRRCGDAGAHTRQGSRVSPSGTPERDGRCDTGGGIGRATRRPGERGGPRPRTRVTPRGDTSGPRHLACDGASCAAWGFIETPRGLDSRSAVAGNPSVACLLGTIVPLAQPLIIEDECDVRELLITRGGRAKRKRDVSDPSDRHECVNSSVCRPCGGRWPSL